MYGKKLTTKAREQVDVKYRRDGKALQRVGRLFPSTMKRSRTNIMNIIVFLLVFCFGLLSMYTLFHHTWIDKQNETNGRVKLDNQGGMVPKLIQSSPSFSSKTSFRDFKSNTHDDKIMIIMDWIVDSSLFGYINYKSLESLLSVYPDADILVLLIGPQGLTLIII